MPGAVADREAHRGPVSVAVETAEHEGLGGCKGRSVRTLAAARSEPGAVSEGAGAERHNRSERTQHTQHTRCEGSRLLSSELPAPTLQPSSSLSLVPRRYSSAPAFRDPANVTPMIAAALISAIAIALVPLPSTPAIKLAANSV